MNGVQSGQGPFARFLITLRGQRPLADKHREELGVEASLFHPGQVDLGEAGLAGLMALGDIPVFVQERSGRVAVRVHGEHLLVKGAGLNQQVRLSFWAWPGVMAELAEDNGWKTAKTINIPARASLLMHPPLFSNGMEISSIPRAGHYGLHPAPREKDQGAASMIRHASNSF